MSDLHAGVWTLAHVSVLVVRPVAAVVDSCRARELFDLILHQTVSVSL